MKWLISLLSTKMEFALAYQLTQAQIIKQALILPPSQIPSGDDVKQMYVSLLKQTKATFGENKDVATLFLKQVIKVTKTTLKKLEYSKDDFKPFLKQIKNDFNQNYASNEYQMVICEPQVISHAPTIGGALTDWMVPQIKQKTKSFIFPIIFGVVLVLFLNLLDNFVDIGEPDELATTLLDEFHKTKFVVLQYNIIINLKWWDLIIGGVKKSEKIIRHPAKIVAAGVNWIYELLVVVIFPIFNDLLQSSKFEHKKHKSGPSTTSRARSPRRSERLRQLQSKCIGCDKDVSFRCSKCKTISYCSEKCQRDDWDEHKLECH